MTTEKKLFVITTLFVVGLTITSFGQNAEKMAKHLTVKIMPEFSPNGSFEFNRGTNDKGEMANALANSFSFAGLKVSKTNPKYLVTISYSWAYSNPRMSWGGQSSRLQCRDMRGQIVDLYNNNAVVVTFKYDGKFDQIPVADAVAANLSQTKNTTAPTQTEKPVQSIVTTATVSTSDVDKNIPITGKTNKNRYALIIGNEDYKKFQTGLQSNQNVLFANNDALVFREYVIKVMGVPEKQAFILTDATSAQMKREIERITELVKLTQNSELIFYYAGHGLPDMETRESYLIPVDVTASDMKDAISLKELYSKLASAKASKVFVFLDACFSGGGRGENGLLAARTVKVKPKGDIVEGNIIAFTAASGEEVSLPLNKESHGLFTYYLLKELKDTQGQLTLDQLKTYLEREIPKASLIENGIRQTPQILVSPDLNEKWLSWKIQD